MMRGSGRGSGVVIFTFCAHVKLGADAAATPSAARIAIVSGTCFFIPGRGCMGCTSRPSNYDVNSQAQLRSAQSKGLGEIAPVRRRRVGFFPFHWESFP